MFFFIWRLQVVMVHHLCNFRSNSVGCRGHSVVYAANVPAYAFPTDIPVGRPLQFLRHHVCLHDHAVLRQITRMY